MHTWRLGSGGWFVGGLLLASACSVYDSELLGVSESPVMRPMPEPDAGEDAGAASEDATVSEDPDEDASTTMTVQPRPVRCGDARVEGDELCDTGIAEGQPGACPTECPPLSACALRVMRGRDCQAACVLIAEACADGDHCCPSDCTSENDNDCSERCGDGIVQDEQETCEQGTDTPCPSEADCDDGNVCTEDTLLGSAGNCNAECANREITELLDGDGCCPKGADANTDDDCTPTCGNDVREADEECDGTRGCSDQCEVMQTAEQLACLDQWGSEDDCMRCACISCTEQISDCFETEDDEFNMHCQGINECAREHDCVGTACYCGGATWSCALAQPGPCAEVINAAALYPDALTVSAEAADPNTAIGRSILLTDCAVTNCPEVCP